MATPTFKAAAFAESLTLKFKDESEFAPKNFTVRAGRVYDKIVQGRVTEGGGSVHAFVNRRTGEVYKAAGWNTPAKNVLGLPDPRYNNVHEATEAADVYGSYLYKK